MLRSKSFLVVSCFVLAMLALPAAAQAPLTGEGLFNRNATPLDINSIPVLATLVKNGAKLFYMGERSGLHGWFIVKDGQVQMIYVAADRNTAIIGGMFTAEGENVTGPQIQALASVNKEVSDLVNNTARQQDDVAKAGAAPGGYAAVPGGAAANATNPLGNNMPAVSLSPGERLLQDLQAAGGVTLGKNSNAEMLMVIDPNNPRCQATWRELRKPVQEGRVQVRLIPAAAPASESARVGAQLLKVSNPLEAWEKHVSGDKSALAGPADELRAQAVKANNDLLKKWNINAMPYIVYRAKDGRVKIVQGEPARMAPILADLLQ